VLFRSVLFQIAVYTNFLVQAVLFSPVLLLPERMVWPIARFWVRSTLWLHRIILGTRDEIRGRENIPVAASSSPPSINPLGRPCGWSSCFTGQPLS
jgi:1-acyl-sn-glycerol-3-phosphate acyltransferase